MKARNRPPRLEPRVAESRPAPPPTDEERLLRSHLAGRGAIGASELRHAVRRVVAGDAGALAGIGLPGVTESEVWEALAAVHGATPVHPEIAPERVVAGARTAAARLEAAAAGGERVAFATAAPASMLGLFVGLARRAAAAGAVLAEDDDAGPVRVDGRMPRWIRWIDGVAVVTDGASALAASGPDAPTEWLFRLGRPDLVVADGPFAQCAAGAAIPFVAFVGLERVALAVAACRDPRGVIVPVHPFRPPRALGALRELLDPARASGIGGAPPEGRHREL